MIKMINGAGTTLTLPWTLMISDSSFQKSVPVVARSGMDGGVRIGYETMRPRELTIRGELGHSEPDEYEGITIDDRRETIAYWDKIMAFLLHSPIRIYRNSNDERFIYGYLQNSQDELIWLGQQIKMTLNFLCPDPFWYGDEVTESAPGTITNLGSAPSLPIVTFSGLGTTASVVNTTTSQTLSLSNDAAMGNVVVDCKEFTAKVGATNVADYMTDAFISGGFELIPGDNVLTGTAASVKYRPRWY